MRRGAVQQLHGHPRGRRPHRRHDGGLCGIPHSDAAQGTPGPGPAGRSPDGAADYWPPRCQPCRCVPGGVLRDYRCGAHRPAGRPGGEEHGRRAHSGGCGGGQAPVRPGVRHYIHLQQRPGGPAGLPAGGRWRSAPDYAGVYRLPSDPGGHARLCASRRTHRPGGLAQGPGDCQHRQVYSEGAGYPPLP